MEQNFTIKLFGFPYIFESKKEISKAKEIADFLAKEVRRVESQHSKKKINLTKDVILISAALNIIDEYFELKKEHNDLLEDISNKALSINRTLDKNIETK